MIAVTVSNAVSWQTQSGKSQMSLAGQFTIARSFCYETAVMTSGTSDPSRSAVSCTLQSPSADVPDYYIFLSTMALKVS
jgi:hypothetical protein